MVIIFRTTWYFVMVVIEAITWIAAFLQWLSHPKVGDEVITDNTYLVFSGNILDCFEQLKYCFWKKLLWNDKHILPILHNLKKSFCHIELWNFRIVLMYANDWFFYPGTWVCPLCEDRKKTQRRRIVDLGARIKRKNSIKKRQKERCPTVGCSGVGNTNGRNNFHRK